MRNAPRITAALLLLTCCPCLVAQPDVAAAVEIFTPAEAPASPSSPKPYFLQKHFVSVDLQALAGLRPDSEITLDLLPGVQFIGVIERVERRGDMRLSLFGHLEDMPFSSFILVVEQTAVVGIVEAPSAALRAKVGYSDNGLHYIAELDDRQFPLCATGASGAAAMGISESPRPTPMDPPEPPPSEPLGGCSQPQAVFDVVIAYTDIAMQAAGGSSAITAECQLAIDGANQGYLNSGISARMRLVYRSNVNYDEDGDFDDHLTRITDPDDGVMDILHTWRNTYKADFVCLWVDDDEDGETCGLAHCDVDEDEAFSIVQWGCAVSNFTFQHEIGHNQGCAHDDDNCSWPCYCAYDSYSYGWRFFGNSGQGWRTVMAYDNEADEYSRINWFSNPSISFDGQPMGVEDEADNARTINATRRHVENFRHSGYDVWADFGHGGAENGSFNEPFNTVAEGAAATVHGNGTPEAPVLWIKAGATSETPTISTRMTIRACGGTVVIGQ